jgi:hypothetical protein
MIEERSFNEIYTDIRIARERKHKITWTPEEIAIDMVVVTKQLIVNLGKFLSTGMDAPAKRIRSESKVLETLGKSFRLRSVTYKVRDI